VGLIKNFRVKKLTSHTLFALDEHIFLKPGAAVMNRPIWMGTSPPSLFLI
jgi:hypothetical protein